jgi:ethanolaminephosphotransferase
LPRELEKDDWKALVLHYLGLDNIAHQGGPSGYVTEAAMIRQCWTDHPDPSAHMMPKQAQMDDVVNLVYNALDTKPHLNNTLFVMLGDHGMTEQGNHGGASPSEIAAAMVFISPKLKSISSGLKSPLPATKNYEYYSVINQVDFVPTVAGLMGFATPTKSLGIFATEFLDLFDQTEDGLHVLFNNAMQMKMLLESEYDTATRNTTACGQQCGTCLEDLNRVICWLGKFEIAKKGWEANSTNNMEEVYQITRTVSFLIVVSTQLTPH